MTCFPCGALSSSYDDISKLSHDMLQTLNAYVSNQCFISGVSLRYSHIVLPWKVNWVGSISFGRCGNCLNPCSRIYGTMLAATENSSSLRYLIPAWPAWLPAIRLISFDSYVLGETSLPIPTHDKTRMSLATFIVSFQPP